MVTEEDACHAFEQEHGSVFLLDPADEQLKSRRNRMGRRCKDALFLHGVKAGKGDGHFSVAFVFRCLETTAPVDATADKVVVGEPTCHKEKARRRPMMKRREASFRKQ